MPDVHNVLVPSPPGCFYRPNNGRAAHSDGNLRGILSGRRSRTPTRAVTIRCHHRNILVPPENKMQFARKAGKDSRQIYTPDRREKPSRLVILRSIRRVSCADEYLCFSNSASTRLCLGFWSRILGALIHASFCISFTSMRNTVSTSMDIISIAWFPIFILPQS